MIKLLQSVIYINFVRHNYYYYAKTINIVYKYFFIKTEKITKLLFEI